MLKAKDITSFSALAFCVGTPQQPPSEEEFRRFAISVAGNNVSLGMTSMLRRIHFEGSTLVVSHLKSQVTGDPSEPIRKLPLAEKRARAEDQQKRLPGVLIRHELEPSHSLIDAVAAACKSGCVKWIHPSLCAKRDDEVQMASKAKPSI